MAICKKCGVSLSKQYSYCLACGEPKEASGSAAGAATETISYNLSVQDEMRIKAAVPILREALREELYGHYSSYICLACGQVNSWQNESCTRCGRNRIRAAILNARGYNIDEVRPLFQGKPKSQEEFAAAAASSSALARRDIDENKPYVINNYLYPQGPGLGSDERILVNAQGQYEIKAYKYTAYNRLLSVFLLLLGVIFLASLFLPYLVDSQAADKVNAEIPGLGILLVMLTALIPGYTVKNAAAAFKALGDPFLLDANHTSVEITCYWLTMILVSIATVMVAFDVVVNIYRIATGQVRKGGHALPGVAMVLIAVAIVACLFFNLEITSAEPYEATMTNRFSIGIGIALALVALIVRFVLGFFVRKVIYKVEKSSFSGGNQHGKAKVSVKETVIAENK